MRAAVKIILKSNSCQSGFRYYALQKGREMGIVGTIRGNSDQGSITIHAEAGDTSLRQFVNILRAGTPLCKVAGIMVVPDRMLNCIYFEILTTENHTTENSLKRGKNGIFRIGFFGL
ncbi:MAG: acylphosphatase [Bacteroidales bacterium]|nr:acylphosphatase [Bacteroidales bacterium]